MKRINLLAIAMVLLTTTGCLERGPVYRPVDFVADSLVHDDVPKAAEETQEMLDELENEPVITVPDIPQESDLLNDKSKMDIEKVMREGF
jgi:predicted small lipoprotein YifL